MADIRENHMGRTDIPGTQPSEDKPKALTAGDAIDLLADAGIFSRVLYHGEPADALDFPVRGIACDSRAVRSGNMFVAKGSAFRPRYLEDAAGLGAMSCVCPDDMADDLSDLVRGVPVIAVTDIRRAMSLLSPVAWGHPDSRIPVVGITGTKGKTTTAYMLRSIVDAAVASGRGVPFSDLKCRRHHGYEVANRDLRQDAIQDDAVATSDGTDDMPRIMLRDTESRQDARDATHSTNAPANAPKPSEAHTSPRCAVMGSIDTYDGIEEFESVNTTPEAPDLWRHVVNAADMGCPAMVMEVSSQALKYGRTDGLHLDFAAFLNIGKDHISPAEHPDFEDYFASKLRIFGMCSTAVVNLDSDHIGRIMGSAKESGCRVLTVSGETVGVPTKVDGIGNVIPDAWAEDVVPHSDGLAFTAVIKGNVGKEFRDGEPTDCTIRVPVRLRFPGLFNVSNALVAALIATDMGIDARDVSDGLAKCHVPGRMEVVGRLDADVTCIVDYAHNALSYRKFFESVSAEFPGRRIVALFGAPGGKAYERREELPREAAKWCSDIVITEEDPAHDDNDAVCAEMDANVPVDAMLRDGTVVRHEVVPERQDAVRRCAEIAKAYADGGQRVLVCLLGKGDEEYIHRGDRFEPMVPDGKAWETACQEASIGI